MVRRRFYTASVNNAGQPISALGRLSPWKQMPGMRRECAVSSHFKRAMPKIGELGLYGSVLARRKPT